MKTRVEISGIDTSRLPTLTHEEAMELLKRAQSGDKAAHEKFVTANLRLVLPDHRTSELFCLPDQS